MTTSIELIARLAHEVNRAFCQLMGDDSQPTWNDSPEWQRDSAINGVRFHLECLRRGVEPGPAESHELWLKQKRSEGWVWGPVKDAEKKQHPCIVPYEDLPADQRLKDYLFAAVVKCFYECPGIDVI